MRKRIDGDKDGERPQISGHRGFGADQPENTIRAFEMAKAQGLDWIEFDVHLTKDEDVIVFHDNSLKRLYNQSHLESIFGNN